MSYCWWHSCSATARQSDRKNLLLTPFLFLLDHFCSKKIRKSSLNTNHTGGGDESPHCHLLEVDGFNFLLDCGWDETFDMVFINNLKKVKIIGR